MTIRNHPEYTQECTHLEDTISHLERELNRLKDPIEASAAFQGAAVRLWREKIKHRDMLQSARQDLYTARVDWKPSGSDMPETFYLGVQQIMERNIFSWAAPFAADIYYNGKPKNEKGMRLLKRIIGIKADQIVHMVDEAHPERGKYFGGVLVDSAQAGAKLGDTYLAELLSAPHSGHLSQIIATIQEKQFEAISAPLRSTVVIQGAPGTGKTIIALHRIAYLLYNNPDLSRSRIRFFAPNPLFKDYVAQVLPELGERDIPQLTFDEWAIALLGLEDRIEHEETAIEFFLEPGRRPAQSAMRMRNARSKGSLLMKSLLDAYIAHLENERFESIRDIVVNASSFPFHSLRASEEWTFTLAKERIVALVEPVLRQENNPPLLKNWSNRAIQILVYELRHHPEMAEIIGARTGMGRDVIDATLERIAESAFTAWTAINVQNAYRRLLRSRALLEELGRPYFSQTVLAMLHLDAPKQGTPLRAGDLAGLLYLHARLNGVETSAQFDLAIVDEAQDFTPLQYLVLRLYSRNGAFTIVGDIAQGLYADKRLVSWDDLKPSFGDVEVREFLQSYRSTDQITEYAHKLLQWTGLGAPSPGVPLGRNGDAVVEGAFGDPVDRARRIAERIKILLKRGGRTAVIAKSAHACVSIAQELHDAGFDDFTLVVRRDDPAHAAVVLIPAYLAKGLEFDNVIIADADAATYQSNILDARLLYVAVTRAASNLAVGWIGQRTLLLDATQSPVESGAGDTGYLHEDMVTIVEYAKFASPARDADTVVRRLAGSRDLDLLKRGKIDRHLLDLMMEQRLGGDDDREEIDRLSPRSLDLLTRNVRIIEEERNENSQAACYSLHLLYGLLRNSLNSNGITEKGANEGDLINQVAELLELYWLLKQRGTFAHGPFTSSLRALSAVREEHRELATRVLLHLRDRGIVEVIGTGTRERIRIAYPWVQPLLAHLLGGSDPSPDDDMLKDMPALSVDLTSSVFLEKKEPVTQ